MPEGRGATEEELGDYLQVIENAQNASLDQEIPIQEIDKNNLANIFDNAKQNLFTEPGKINEFFMKNMKENSLFLQAACEARNVASVRGRALDFLRERGSVSEAEESIFKALASDVIDDAFKHTKEPEKAIFTFAIELDPNNPKNFSFLVINPTSRKSKDFRNAPHVLGLGTGIKVSMAEELGGKIKNLDIEEEKVTTFHGFLFERGISLLEPKHERDLL